MTNWRFPPVWTDVSLWTLSYGVWDYAAIDLGDDQPEPTKPELVECADGKLRTTEAKAEYEAHIWDQLKLSSVG